LRRILYGGFWFDFVKIKFLSAIGAIAECESDDLIDEVGGDGLAEVLCVTGLGSDFPFRFLIGDGSVGELDIRCGQLEHSLP